jgi:hypothetical protein
VAHLNVREHRIEAKIAYVGVRPDDIESTFERLRADAAFVRAGAHALEWRPPQTKRFRDCDLVVRVVAGPADDADGVLVAESAGSTDVTTLKTGLERTLAEILKTFDAASPALSPNADERMAAHPLLSALRDVLRATVKEHVDEIALRLQTHVDTKLDASFADIRGRLDAIEAKTGDDALALHVIQVMDETEAQLRLLVEELKKPKKSWFT